MFGGLGFGFRASSLGFAVYGPGVRFRVWIASEE